jgi:response regulator RpfG family c-di-GMP phosphodiesterase
VLEVPLLANDESLSFDPKLREKAASTRNGLGAYLSHPIKRKSSNIISKQSEEGYPNSCSLANKKGENQTKNIEAEILTVRTQNKELFGENERLRRKIRELQQCNQNLERQIEHLESSMKHQISAKTELEGEVARLRRQIM